MDEELVMEVREPVEQASAMASREVKELLERGKHKGKSGKNRKKFVL